MRHHSFAPATTKPICLLVQEIRADEIRKAYIDPFNEIEVEDVLVLDLHNTPGKKKTPKAEMVEYFTSIILPILEEQQTRYIVVTDAEYFKAITGQVKADSNLGYVMKSAFSDHLVLYAPNYRMIFYDPDKVQTKIAAAMNAMIAHAKGEYSSPGTGIITSCDFPSGYVAIEKALQALLARNCDLTSDIEAYGLKHYTAGIGTISFAWNQSEGIAFSVDHQIDMDGRHVRINNTKVKKALKDFFIELHNRGHHIKWHSIGYDVYVLIYELFMKDILDTAGLLQGMEILLSRWDCTKLISYLATNSCSGNKLSLKEQAQEYAGNYAVDNIKDISLIPQSELLMYNLVDACSTWYVYNKHWPTVIADNQVQVYEELFKPAMLDIIQMQLTGLPINMKRTKEVADILQKDADTAINKLRDHRLIQQFEYYLEEDHVKARNAKLKKKQIAIGDEPQEFNPNSDHQLQKLLFEVLALPVLDLTDNKEPSTKKKVLEALKNHTSDPEVIELLEILLDYKAVAIILTTFIPAMLEAVEGPDGWHYLCGNFNLGGTVSGRLSSSDPNLQNLPASSKYAKLIKSCIEAPPGWLFCGLDFASLEDRISALTTKDPNKLKVYTDGYDGHSLRAFAYFGHRMPDIDPTSVNSINSIQKKYPKERQDSKAPTFALTYQGTYSTLMKNCGFDEQVSRSIEKRYHDLYEVSDKWVMDRLKQATRTGYIEIAFGLRLRTPLLHQVILGTSKTPSAASAEGRTAGNALGQSWCLLNSRAASEFMSKVRQSEFRLDIKPCAQIHDAQYYLIRDDICVVSYANKHLVIAVQWQNHPEIAHPDVKLGGELDIFYPTWNDPITIANGLDSDGIMLVIQAEMEARAAKTTATTP